MTFSKFCLYFAEFFVFFFAGKHSHLCFPGNSDFAKEEKANPGRAFILFWECREQAVTQQSFPIHQSDSFSRIQLIRGRSICYVWALLNTNFFYKLKSIFVWLRSTSKMSSD